MPGQRDVRELLAACQRGDAGAWDTFVRRYSRLVFSVANRYRLRGIDAEDIHQAVFLAAVRHLDQLRAADRVAAWLVTTTHRECWKFARKKSLAVDMTGDFADIDAPAVELLADEEALQALREELPNLPDRCQEVLRAVFSGGTRPDYALIASRLGVAIGSIGPTRMRCLEKLAALMRKRGFSVEVPSDEGAEPGGAED